MNESLALKTNCIAADTDVIIFLPVCVDICCDTMLDTHLRRSRMLFTCCKVKSSLTFQLLRPSLLLQSDSGEGSGIHTTRQRHTSDAETWKDTEVLEAYRSHIGTYCIRIEGMMFTLTQ